MNSNAKKFLFYFFVTLIAFGIYFNFIYNADTIKITKEHKQAYEDYLNEQFNIMSNETTHSDLKYLKDKQEKLFKLVEDKKPIALKYVAPEVFQSGYEFTFEELGYYPSVVISYTWQACTNETGIDFFCNPYATSEQQNKYLDLLINGTMISISNAYSFIYEQIGNKALPDPSTFTTLVKLGACHYAATKQLYYLSVTDLSFKAAIYEYSYDALAELIAYYFTTDELDEYLYPKKYEMFQLGLTGKVYKDESIDLYTSFKEDGLKTIKLKGGQEFYSYVYFTDQNGNYWNDVGYGLLPVYEHTNDFKYLDKERSLDYD